MVKMKKFVIIGILILVSPITFFSQTRPPKDNDYKDDSEDYFTDSVFHQYYKEKDLSLVLGYQLQRNHFAELGIAIKNNGVIGPHPNTSIFLFSNEVKINQMKNFFVLGQKIGVWGGNGIAMGLNLIHYTDFRKSSLQFRPEVGMGIDIFRVVYGYNCSLVNKDFAGINKHNFTLNLLIDLKRLKTTNEYRY
jgi:hypothetical protein